MAPNIVKTYTATRTSQTLINGEVFVGMQKNLSPVFLGQMGLTIAAASKARLSGNIWDDADPIFDNYNYQYQIQHTHIALQGKLLMDRDYWFIPWINGSLGLGWNHAYHFQNTPLIPEAIAMPNFSSYTQTSFIYTVGAGIQKNLNLNWQIGIGYEFADWGQSQLKRAPNQILNSGLSLDHLYTNGVLLNITYLA